MDYKDALKVHVLKPEILKLELPQDFDIEKVVSLLRKKHPSMWIYYPHRVGEVREALDQMVSEGIMKSIIFSKKMTDGSKTEKMYSFAYD
jgi:hypothetical protein